MKRNLLLFGIKVCNFEPGGVTIKEAVLKWGTLRAATVERNVCVCVRKDFVCTLLLGQVLALRAVIGQRVDRGSVVLLLAGAVWVVG